MSFQPQVPSISQPPPPVAAELTIKGKRRKGLIVLGIIVLVGGVLGGGAMATKSMTNYEDAVKSLARAPVGCTTTLVFDKPATFTVYAETKGKLGELSGDCEANGSEYEHPGDKLPRLSMTVVDSNGDEIDMERGTTASYDVDGYVGTGVRTLTIDEAGTYRLNVESEDTDFAVAIGKNPKDDTELLKLIGGAVVLGGFVLGLLFLLLGLRRRRPDMAMADVRNPAAPMPGWPPGPYAGVAPTAPPAPPMHPGFRPEPPPVPEPIGAPGQPPIRLPDRPSTPGFAPPSFAPPPPPADAPPTSPPTMPPSAGPPTAGPPPVPGGGGWTVPDDTDDD